MLLKLIKYAAISSLLLSAGCGSTTKKDKSKKVVEDSLRAPLETQADKISDCYRFASTNDKKALEGKIILQWVIDGLGKAKNIASKKNTTGSEELAACISKAVMQVSFPKELATRTIQYPFEFKSKK